MKLIKIEEDRKFLISQREKGRKGAMVGVDKVYTEFETRKWQRLEKEAKRKLKSLESGKNQSLLEFRSEDEEFEVMTSQLDMESQHLLPNLQTSTPSESNSGLGGSGTETKSHSVIKRGKINVMTEKVVATLDKCKISDRDATRIIIAVAEALNINADDLIVNRSSIRRKRKLIRSSEAANIRQNLNELNARNVVVHWDGKLLPELTGRKKVDRLPVVITFDGNEYLLGVPSLEDSKGVTQASAIFKILNDWGVVDSVTALCCDTTSSNLGRLSGAAVKVEELIGRNLLLVPCRHHIYELMLKAAFDSQLGCTSNYFYFSK